MSSRIDQLKELGALKEQGLLTEEEFAQQKSKLLGG
ncbi:SHOCT domain-containing protein [Streptomyces lavendulae]